MTSASDTAYQNLWSYLSGIDGIDEVRLFNRSVHEPVRWLLGDGRTLLMTEQVDFLWMRLVDVPTALAARRYAAAGEVVLEVVDADGYDFGSGRYVLRTEREYVECDRTERSADLVITQRALASIYLGGFRLAELQLADVAKENTAGALALVDLMFSTPLPPWTGTWF